jgi:hypothetical protein
MNLVVNRALLLSGALGAALFMRPMVLSASDSVLNQSIQSLKTRQSVQEDSDRGVPRRNLWLQIGASCLLIATCSGLTLASSREKRHRERDQQRIAASLSTAMRNGLLDEVEHVDVPIWSLRAEEEETEHEPKALILSRYRTLGYSGELRERAVDGENLPVRTIFLCDPGQIVTDEELLLGIPRAVLKTKPQQAPVPWLISEISPSPEEDTPEADLDSEPYRLPIELPSSAGCLPLQ